MGSLLTGTLTIVIAPVQSRRSRVIVGNLNITGSGIRPIETDPILFVYSNAVLAFVVTRQDL